MSDNHDQPEVEVVDEHGSPLILATEMLPQQIPILPAATKPVFPGMLFPLILSPGPMADLVKELSEDEKKVIGVVLAREEFDMNRPETVTRQLYKIGTAARLARAEFGADGSVRALLQGMMRFEVVNIGLREGQLRAHVVYLREDDQETKTDQIKALSLAVINTLRELNNANQLFSEEIRMFLNRGSWDEPGRLADFAASITSAEPGQLQEVLAAIDIEERLNKVLMLLRQELDINQLKEKITHQIEERISKQQREFFLHEQLKAIKEELGLEKDDKAAEVERYQERLKELTLPEAARKRIDEEMNKLKLLSSQSPEFQVARNYLDWLTSLPWGKFTDDKLDVKRARKILDRDHYGLQDVKDRILEFIGVAKLKGSIEGSILCLAGPPGTGKTSLGRGIAEALGREFFRFSLGGMRDEAEIKGHRRTYIGALPGKFIQTMRNTGTQNPVIMLDEIDKIGKSFQGDPASALLEVLDPEQNSNFLDHYLDVSFDLSKVLFIATANVVETIPAPLLDRMELIRLSGYILEEKLSIAKRHLVPRLLPKHGLTKKDIRFLDSGLKTMISGYAREAGVRALEKAIRGCMRKVAAQKAAGEIKGQLSVKKDNVADLLGRPVFPEEQMLKGNTPGIATGLAWTPLGGTVLSIEAMKIPGKGGFKQTGQLGDVMVESSTIAFSYIHANSEAFGIDNSVYQKSLVHLHVPAGATPKDGPSAGITMASALISMLTRQKLPARLAMTGELTLTGKVLPVGGIKEKVIAARRSGIKDVLLPAANEKDYDEIPEHVIKGINVHYVSDYKEVYALLFEDGLKDLRAARRKKKSKQKTKKKRK